jgi:hypothetical protein
LAVFELPVRRCALPQDQGQRHILWSPSGDSPNAAQATIFRESLPEYQHLHDPDPKKRLKLARKAGNGAPDSRIGISPVLRLCNIF